MSPGLPRGAAHGESGRPAGTWRAARTARTCRGGAQGRGAGPRHDAGGEGWGRRRSSRSRGLFGKSWPAPKDRDRPHSGRSPPPTLGWGSGCQCPVEEAFPSPKRGTESQRGPKRNRRGGKRPFGCGHRVDRTGAFRSSVLPSLPWPCARSVHSAPEYGARRVRRPPSRSQTTSACIRSFRVHAPFGGGPLEGPVPIAVGGDGWTYFASIPPHCLTGELGSPWSGRTPGVLAPPTVVGVTAHSESTCSLEI